MKKAKKIFNGMAKGKVVELDNLKLIRVCKQHGISQTVLSYHTGIALTNINHMFTGKIKRVRAQTLARIAYVFDKEPREFTNRLTDKEFDKILNSY